jgi:prepilin-type N-terminal cleavage/methylation domain-containing protein
LARRGKNRSENGFSLIELLIVITILPLIVGALALGLVSVLSLQSGIANRLSDTGDAQVISANYEKDIQGAQYLTTDSSSTPQCGSGTGTQLLGLESDLNQTTGVFQTDISYVSVHSGTSATYALRRLECTSGSLTPSSDSTLAFGLPSGQAPPTVTCVTGQAASVCSASTQQWISAQNVSQVVFPITEPTSHYPYTLTASPVASSSSVTAGAPVTVSTTTSCNFPSPNTGTYSSNLCFVDFGILTGSSLTAAQNGCLEISVSLPGDYTLYFCISLTGANVGAFTLPSYSAAFLGNTVNSVPFYTGISGDPALYQTTSGTSVVTFNNITVVNSSGALATGWQAVSADAESTDAGESITWNSPGNTLTVIPNGESGQTQPVGSACQSGAGLTGSGTSTVVCAATTSNSQQTGAAMVEAPSPNTMSATMVGGGLEAVTFGLLLS